MIHKSVLSVINFTIKKNLIMLQLHLSCVFGKCVSNLTHFIEYECI